MSLPPSRSARIAERRRRTWRSLVTGKIIHREPVPYLRIARQGSGPAAGRVAEDQVKLLLERKLRCVQHTKVNT